MPQRNIPLTVGGAAVLACAFLVFASGCAAGRNDATGEIVLGVGVAKLTESTNQAFGQLADMVVPGAGGAVGLIAALGLGWAKSHANAKSTAAARAAADSEWEAAEVARKLRDRDRLLAAADPASVSRIVAGVVPTGPAPDAGAGGPVPVQHQPETPHV